jgi:LAGLIDADG endonuclease
VTILKWIIESAGIKDERVISKFNTSVTKRNKISSIKKIDIISKERTKQVKPIMEDDFGYYLAGLIDGDGHFSMTGQLIIVFHILDVSLAYYIKKKLRYGRVKKVKNKKAVIFVISSKKGLEIVFNIINGKLRHINKIIQVNKILNNDNYKDIRKNFNFSIDNNQDLNNYWLSGFADADASFQIKILDRINRKKPEIRLSFQINQKYKDILILIKNYLGGNIGYRSTQDTYYYNSTSFGSAKKVIKYFDKFTLLSSKFVHYLKWRKAYLLIQNRNDLTISGINKIKNLKLSMKKIDI